MKYLVLTFLVFYAVTVIQGYKILGVFGYCAHSHFKTGFRLMKELADRGHNVTMISCYPQKEPIENYRDISVAETIEPTNEINAVLLDYGELSYLGALKSGFIAGSMYTRNFFKTKPVQELINSTESFDLVIMENTVNEAMMIFHHRFNCPLILLVPGRSSIFNNYLIGDVPPLSFVPNFLSYYGSKMNFWQRLQNAYLQIAGEISVHFYHIPEQAKIVKDFFPDAPDLHTIMYNVSMMLTNSHTCLSDPIPQQSNVKQIGGFHVLPNKPLPKEIKQFLDSATDGAILFSMGSILRSDNLEPKMKNAILNVFSKIKQKVIWKFETDLPEKPDNVMILDWLPQQDVLAHPNIIGFISHGGLLGTLEAIHHGVPILGLPVYWDQTTNIEDAVRQGFAIRMDLKNLDEDLFGKVLNELINNPKYRANAKQRSKIMHDQPTRQIDEAVFWVEYVVRHKGAYHLKSPALSLKWYQLYLVDIILFVGTILFVIFWIFWIIVKLLFGKKKVVAKKNKTS